MENECDLPVSMWCVQKCSSNLPTSTHTQSNNKIHSMPSTLEEKAATVAEPHYDDSSDEAPESVSLHTAQALAMQEQQRQQAIS
jgi:hypothetical protein